MRLTYSVSIQASLLAALLGYDMAVAQYISGNCMVGGVDAYAEDEIEDDEPKKKKRRGTGQHPQVVMNREVAEVFEEKSKDIINWDDPESFKEAAKYKARPTHFMTKLVACEKLSRDVVNELEIGD